MAREKNKPKADTELDPKPAETSVEQPKDEVKEGPVQNHPFEHTVGTVTMQNISSPVPAVDVNKGLTKIKIEYPADYKGEKHFVDGQQRFISKEGADQLVELGIAKII
jgi:hypothetical protein